MKSDKPLPNCLELKFYCRWRLAQKSDCVYWKKGLKCIDSYYCKYSGECGCTSAVAQTNAMVLALKDMGFEVKLTAKGGTNHDR